MSSLRRGRVLAALTPLVPVVALLAPTASATPHPSTPPTTRPVWQEVLRDDFSATRLPRACTGDPRAARAARWDGVPRPRVAGGLLRLDIATSGARAAGIGCPELAHASGRLVVRARVPYGRGIVGLWPKSGDGWTTVEVRRFEVVVTNGYDGGQERRAVPGRFADAFHTYVVEWTPSRTRVLIDTRQVLSSPRAFRGARWPGLAVAGESTRGASAASTPRPELVADTMAFFVDTTPRPTPTSSAAPPAASDPRPLRPGPLLTTLAGVSVAVLGLAFYGLLAVLTRRRLAR